MVGTSNWRLVASDRSAPGATTHDTARLALARTLLGERDEISASGL